VLFATPVAPHLEALVARSDAQPLNVMMPTRATITCTGVAVLALLTSGCGGTHSPGVASIGSANSGSGARPASPSAPTSADAAAASRWMRLHGVPNFPDPIPFNGRLHFGFTVKSGINPDTASAEIPRPLRKRPRKTGVSV
jgi:hypothetical protein